MMLVLVEALEPFVTLLPDGEMVTAIRGQRVMLPKQRADDLVNARLVTYATKGAPENKADDDTKKTASVRSSRRRKPPAV